MTQQSLPLDAPTADATRLAYASVASIRERMTYQQALAIPAIAIALRCYAEAIQRKGEV